MLFYISEIYHFGTKNFMKILVKFIEDKNIGTYQLDRDITINS